MTQEDKKLLLVDLSARLPYKVKVRLYEKETCILIGIDGHEVYLDVDSDPFRIESIEPYLRPMSSMTKGERQEYNKFNDFGSANLRRYEYEDFILYIPSFERVDWLNSHHFDYRGLIEKGLALKATEDMYK